MCTDPLDKKTENNKNNHSSTGIIPPYWADDLRETLLVDGFDSVISKLENWFIDLGVNPEKP